jgi:uncharacterized protein (TIGR03437 family)
LFPIFIQENGSLNSENNPVAAETVITFFTTGTGQTDPPSLDGQIGAVPLLRVQGPVSALILGQPAEVIYAGVIPGVVNAVQQFQVRVPMATPAGIARFQIVLGVDTFDISSL